MNFLQKTGLLTGALLSLQLGAMCQQEEPPPPEFVQQLENLPLPGTTDTSVQNVVLTLGSQDYKISTFELSKKYNKPVSAAGESTKRLNELIKAKSSAAYKVLELIKSLRDAAISLC